VIVSSSRTVLFPNPSLQAYWLFIQVYYTTALLPELSLQRIMHLARRQETGDFLNFHLTWLMPHSDMSQSDFSTLKECVDHPLIYTLHLFTSLL
jgi:hypothetical protein